MIEKIYIVLCTIDGETGVDYVFKNEEDAMKRIDGLKTRGLKAWFEVWYMDEIPDGDYKTWVDKESYM